MTDTFDYSGLASHVRAIALPHHASDVLRTRIEAAFVPRSDYSDMLRNVTARAEAAEARVKVLEEALIRLRDCDWVITLPDRMDAVRDVARQALGGEHA